MVQYADNLDTPHYSFGVSNKFYLCLGIVVSCLNLFLVTLYRLQVVVTLYTPVYVIISDFVTL